VTLGLDQSEQAPVFQRQLRLLVLREERVLVGSSDAAKRPGSVAGVKLC
jgi:hypothetical protein